MYSHNFIYLAYTLLNLASTDFACSSYVSPQLNIIFDGTHSEINHTLTVSEIEGMLKGRPLSTELQYYYNSHFKDSAVPGITLMKLDTDIKVNTKHLFQDGRPTGCLQIDDIQIKMTMQQTVYIGNEYPEESCNYEAILQHEKKHLKANQSITRNYDTVLQSAIRNQVDSYLKGLGTGPFYNSDIKKIRKEVVSRISALVAEEQEPLSKEIYIAHKNIDTAEEYKNVSTQCSKWPRTEKPKATVHRIYND
jgi:hypothetical protein